MTIVTVLGFAFSTIARISAVSRPERSATPTPSSATSTVPSGTKPVKLVTRFSTMRRNPSAFIRLTTSIRPFGARPEAPSGRGSVTATSSQPRMPLNSTTATENIANSVTGCGSALPSASTTLRKRVIRDGAAVRGASLPFSAKRFLPRKSAGSINHFAAGAAAAAPLTVSCYVRGLIRISCERRPRHSSAN